MQSEVKNPVAGRVRLGGGFLEKWAMSRCLRRALVVSSSWLNKDSEL